MEWVMSVTEFNIIFYKIFVKLKKYPLDGPVDIF